MASDAADFSFVPSGLPIIQAGHPPNRSAGRT
jgi:hypothetical protein